MGGGEDILGEACRGENFVWVKQGFPEWGEVWEEAHLHSQKQIIEKPSLDALKFVFLNSYWREGERF